MLKFAKHLKNSYSALSAMKRKLKLVKKTAIKQLKIEEEVQSIESSDDEEQQGPITRPNDLLIGYHVSISGKGKDKGIHNAILNAAAVKCHKTFAIFVGNQKTWAPKGFTNEQALVFKQYCEKYGYDTRKILPHGSYLVNLGSCDEEKLRKSRELFLTEMTRCAQLGITMLNFHPGSTLGEISEEECCTRVAQSLNWIHSQTSEDYNLGSVITVIENTAGQGNNIGYKFEHIKSIIDQVKNKDRVGVCLDTCHMFAAGYDLRNHETCEKTFAKFSSVVGFEYLKAMHINDSKGSLQCRTDRHENIGNGKIGKKCFKYIVNDSRFRNIPLILETPGGKQDIEIDMLFRMVKSKSNVKDLKNV